MKAIVDPEVCTGCALCPETCPEVFEMKDDLAVVKADPVPAASAATCRRAMEECPASAISVQD